MFKRLSDWWKSHTEYQFTEIEKSIITILNNVIYDRDTEIYTSDDSIFIIKFINGFCKITDSCIKLYCTDKLVLHDITPGMAYKVKQLIRAKVKDDVSKVEEELDSKIINFIKNM